MLLALVGLGAAATYTDLRARVIPNWLTGAGALGVAVWGIATGTGATGLAGRWGLEDRRRARRRIGARRSARDAGGGGGAVERGGGGPGASARDLVAHPPTLGPISGRGVLGCMALAGDPTVSRHRNGRSSGRGVEG